MFSAASPLRKRGKHMEKSLAYHASTRGVPACLTKEARAAELGGPSEWSKVEAREEDKYF